MAKARARAQARRVKDKWKAKTWYKLVAPPMFNKATLADALADDPEKLIDRTVMTTLQDMTGDFKQMHVKLHFQVHEVNGSNAETRFVGHTLTSDYVRRMVRRNHSKVSGTFEVTTKDGAVLRVKPFAVSERRSQASQQAEIRKIMGETLRSIASERTLAGFTKGVIDGEIAATINKSAKKLYPLRRVEIARTDVTVHPTQVVEDDVKAFDEPGKDEPEEPEPAAEEDEADEAEEKASEEPDEDGESEEEAEEEAAEKPGDEQPEEKTDADEDVEPAKTDDEPPADEDDEAEPEEPPAPEADSGDEDEASEAKEEAEAEAKTEA